MKTKEEFMAELVSYLEEDPDGKQSLFSRYHPQRADMARVRQAQIASLQEPDGWWFGTAPVFGCPKCGAYIKAVDFETVRDFEDASEPPACDRCGEPMARQWRYLLDGQKFEFTQLVAFEGEAQRATTEHIKTTAFAARPLD